MIGTTILVLKAILRHCVAPMRRSTVEIANFGARGSRQIFDFRPGQLEIEWNVT
jgi:hypothetical protein